MKRIILGALVGVLVAALSAPAARAGIDEGYVAYKRGDYATAFREFRPLAEQGIATFQYILGIMYGEGEGVTQDSVEAVKWYRLAAAQGNVVAQVNLGIMYELGQGVSQDYAEAAKWYRKAADQGEASAQINLGLLYAKSLGVTQDFTEAYFWFYLAFKEGRKEATKYLTYVSARLSQDKIAEVKWRRPSGNP